MRPVARIALLAALAGGALGAAPAAPAAPAAHAPPGPVAVGVSAREFSLSLYRSRVAPGVVRFNLTNFGEDGHDLAVVAPGGRVAARLAEVGGAGGRGRLEVRLRRAGTYTLLCTIADHERRGMRARLHVRR